MGGLGAGQETGLSALTKQGFSRRVELILICKIGASRESRWVVRGWGRKVGGRGEKAQPSLGAGVREMAKVRGVRRISEQITEGRHLTNVSHYPIILGLSFPSQCGDCSTCFKRVVKIKGLIYVK